MWNGGRVEFEWNFCQGYPWFGTWIQLGLVHGNISGSEINFEQGGIWSFKWELFVEEEEEERGGLIVWCPTFYFALWGSVVFEGSKGGELVSVVEKEVGFAVEGGR